jgi:hypothetical protein
MSIETAIEAVIEVLREMDAESTYRLRGYQDYLIEQGCQEFNSESIQDEVPITKTLARRLSTKDIVAKPGPYPNSLKSCDIVLSSDSGPCWLEAKVVYTTYFTGDRKRRAKNIRSKMGALVGDWNQKLSTLTRRDARYIVALLIGFQTSPDQFGDELVKECLDSRLQLPWQKREVMWDCRQGLSSDYLFQNRIWIWHREVPEESAVMASQGTFLEANR